MDKRTVGIALFASFAISCGAHNKVTNPHGSPPRKQTKVHRLYLNTVYEPIERLQLLLILNSAGRIDTESARGTGFCVDSRHVLTNNHVVYNEKEKKYDEKIEMVFFQLEPNGAMLREFMRFKMRIIKTDTRLDLALLEAVDNDFFCSEVSFAKIAPSLGDAGWRFGFNRGWKYTPVIFRGLEKEVKDNDDGGSNFKIDAYIYETRVGRGASGGPVFDKFGRVIGITTRMRENPRVIRDVNDRMLIITTQLVYSPTLEDIKKFLSR